MKTVRGAMSVLGALAVLIAGSPPGHAQVNGFTGIDPNFVGMDHGMKMAQDIGPSSPACHQPRGAPL